jgi:tetratricopeptide (TPR) repeat protein
MSYLPRPNNPYDHASLDSATVDTMQFARDTLSRKSGDCADVVALLASVLESMTVTTAALDAPGHLFLMFDTGETRKGALGLPEDWLVAYAGSYWIPLEATLVGSSFTEAWRQGAEEYRRYESQGKLTVIDTHRAWKTFEPATLPEVASGAPAPTREAIEAKFLPDWKALVELRWKTASEALRKGAGAALTPQAALQLGLLAVEFRRYAEAKTYFTSAAAEGAASAAAAYNNLGNLALIAGDAQTAAAHYGRSREKDARDAEVSLNLARAYLQLAKPAQAASAFEQAMALDPSLREAYPDVSVLAP